MKVTDEMVEAGARAIFDAAPFRQNEGPFESQSGRYQDITRAYARAALTAALAVVDMVTSEDLDWLESEFMSLSLATQSEYSCSAKEDQEYSEERNRAEALFDKIRAMICALAPEE